MAIKHFNVYRKVSFYGTERACVGFSGFEICPGRKAMSKKVSQVLRTRGSTVFQFYLPGVIAMFLPLVLSHFILHSLVSIDILQGKWHCFHCLIHFSLHPPSTAVDRVINKGWFVTSFVVFQLCFDFVVFDCCVFCCW